MRILLLISCIVALFSCKQPHQEKQPLSGEDITDAKKTVNATLDSMEEAFKRRDYSFMLKFLAPEGLYAGTDPKELWTKTQLGTFLTRPGHDTSNINFAIQKRDILLNDDGRSAVTVEQYYLPAMSKVIMVRSISRLTKRENGWIIDFYSWNMIPNNEDIEKLNKSLGQ
jgi:hypothetical protein